MRLLLILLTIPFLMTGQSKFFINLNLDFSTPYTQSYFYNSETYAINNVELRDKNMVFNTYGLSFSTNYSIFKKWSVGLTIGSYTDTEKYLTQVRAGVLTRFFPKNEQLFNFNVKLQQIFSLNKTKFKDGVNLRIGTEFPVFKINKQKFLIAVFFEQNYYVMDDAYKILNLSDEVPRNLTLHSFGLGLNWFL